MVTLGFKNPALRLYSKRLHTVLGGFASRRSYSQRRFITNSADPPQMSLEYSVGTDIKEDASHVKHGENGVRENSPPTLSAKAEEGVNSSEMCSSSSISQFLVDVGKELAESQPVELFEVEDEVPLQGIHNSGLSKEGLYTYSENGVDYLLESTDKYDDYRTMEELLKYKTPWVKSVGNQVSSDINVSDDQIMRTLDGLKERTFRGEPDVPFVNGSLTYVGKVPDTKFLEDTLPAIEEEDDESTLRKAVAHGTPFHAAMSKLRPSGDVNLVRKARIDGRLRGHYVQFERNKLSLPQGSVLFDTSVPVAGAVRRKEDGWLQAPLVKCVEPTKWVVADDRGGARLSQEFRSKTNDSVVSGFLNFFKLCDLLPLFKYASDGLFGNFKLWFSHLYDSTSRWRGGFCCHKLYYFLRSVLSVVNEILELSFADKYSIENFTIFMGHGIKIILDFELNLSSPNKKEALKIEGPFDGPIARSIRGRITHWVDRTTSRGYRPRREGQIVTFATRRLWSIERDEQAGMIVHSSMEIIHKVGVLDAALAFIRLKHYKRAAFQLWSLITDKYSFLSMVRALVDSCREYKNLGTDWVDPNFFNDLESEADVDQVEGPKEIENALLVKKFKILLSAVMMENFAKNMPDFLSSAIAKVSSAASVMFTFGDVYDSLVGFVSVLVQKCIEFTISWDWRVFLDSGGFSTWIVRASDWASVADGKVKKYSTIMELIAVGESLKTEAEGYMLADQERELGARKFTNDYMVTYRYLTQKLTKVTNDMNSAQQRDKPPATLLVLGPPGAGKTTLAQDVLRFQLIHEGRSRDANGDPVTTGADMYDVPMLDAHWNNCHKPRMVIFNDIRGDGYSANSPNMNVPEMMRLAADTAPFYTPQADLQDKVQCVIDPGYIFGTSNSMKWDFSCYGTDWAKLIRRYPHLYYLAYPKDQYNIDISPNGSDHGELKDPKLQYCNAFRDTMRVYRCEMQHSAGRITFVRTGFVCNGMDAFLLEIKKDYLKDASRVPYHPVSGIHRCCMDTPLDRHPNRPCLPGCDFQLPPPPVTPWTRSPPVEDNSDGLPFFDVADVQCWPMVENVSDKVSDKVAERVANKYVEKASRMYEEAKPYIKIFSAALVILSAAWAGSKAMASKKDKEVKVPEAVINPLKAEFTPSFINRFAISPAEKAEVPNPPGWLNSSRAYATLSPVSKTSSFKDVVAMVASNMVEFYVDDPDHFGSGVFLSSEYLMLNTHTLEYFKGKKVTVKTSKDNDFRYQFEFDRYVSEGDITVAHVPTYPASNIIKHLAISVGSRFKAWFNGTYVNVEKGGANFGGKLGMTKEIVLMYEAETSFGYCGKVLVADVESKGVIVGMHIAKMTDGTAAALILDKKIIDGLIAKLSVSPPTSFTVENIVDEVQALHPKSRFRSAYNCPLVVLGTFEKSNKIAKSDVVRTPMYELAYKMLKDKRTIPTLHIDGMKVDGVWKAPYVHKFKGMSLPMLNFSRIELQTAVKDYLSGAPVAKLSPIPMEQVFCGVEGNKLLKTMKMSTSAGIYQRFVPNKSYLFSKEEMVINKELAERVESMAIHMIDSVHMEHQKWSLKSEVVTEKKENDKKYRYFMINDFVNLILFRIFVSPLVAHMYANKEFFECYGSFNPASPEFGKHYTNIANRMWMFLADIKHMDSSHRSLVIDEVANVLYLLALMCGYNEESALIVRNLVRSVCFSLVELNGDLGMLNEGMGSGIYVTFLVNCLVLCLMYRVCWFRVDTAPFRAFNTLMAGGDDSVLGTDSHMMCGSHIARTFRDFGYEVSPPIDKNGAIQEHFDISEFTFLQRSPSFINFKGENFIAGKLNTDSIWKSIGWEQPSPEVSHHDRMAQVLDASRREMALHGKDALEEFDRLIDPYPYKFRKLSYDEIIGKYILGKLFDDIIDGYLAEEKDVLCLQSPLLPQGFAWSPIRKDGLPVNVNTTCVGHRHYEKLFSGTLLLALDGVGDSWRAFAMQEVYNRDRYIKTNPPANFIGNDNRLVDGQKTTSFQMSSMVSSTAQPPHASADYGNIESPISLADSLSRPVHVGTFTWTPLSTSTVITDLYALWRTDVLIDSKLLGFKFFRGRPKLRFVVNGFVFYYGKLVAAVDLNPGDDTTCSSAKNPQINTYRMVNVCQAAMAPHVSIDPSMSITYDLDVPFYSATGWYNRFNLAKAPVMSLNFHVLNPLASANDVAPTSVDIQIYFIMEDCELSVPSVGALEGPEVAFVEGPKVPKESTTQGTISKPLMIVSNMAGMAKEIPILAPFAGPIEVATSLGSKIAAFLGYSKPAILEESRPLMNMTTNQPALMEGRVGYSKLTGDPKQEVAVSSAAASVGHDSDMLIGEIASRYGLLTTLEWTTSGLTGAVLVSPNLSWDGTSDLQHTPLSFVSFAFKYWSGSLTYKIEIVASGMHRGAIGVSWIPYSDPPGGSVLDYPVKFLTKIIDISQTKTVEFSVPYAGDFPIIETNESNGVLRFYEINPIKSAGSTSSIYINVYVKAGDDFVLYRPDPAPLADMTYLPVAATEGPGDDESVEPIAETSSPSNVLDTTWGREKLYFGEVITSIKQLCSREILTYQGMDNCTHHSERYNIPPRAILPAEPHVAINTPTLMCFGFTYEAYFSPAFLASRGGRRFKVVWKGVQESNLFLPIAPTDAPTSAFTVENDGSNLKWFEFTDYLPQSGLTANKLRAMSYTANGAALESTWIHPALEFEVPYTTPARFINPRKTIDLYKATCVGLVPSVVAQDNTYDNEAGTFRAIEIWTSVADDFSLHGFMYVPLMRPISFS